MSFNLHFFRPLSFQGSGWRVLTPYFVDLEMVSCLPLSGGSADYNPTTEHCPSHHITFYQNKMQITSMPDDHSQENGICFYIAVAMGILGPDKEYHVFVEMVHRLGTPAGLDVKVEDVEKVEKDAKWAAHGVGINVIYKDEDGDIIPVYASKKPNPTRTVVLLLFHCQNSQGEQKMHYALVSDPLRLIRHKGKIRKDTSKEQLYQKHPCYNCMNTFWTPEALGNHQRFCLKNPTRRVLMPHQSEKLVFDAKRLTEEGRSIEERTFKSAYLCFFDYETLATKAKRKCTCSDEILENTRRLKQEEEEWQQMSLDDKIEFIIQAKMELSLDDDPNLEEDLEALTISKLFETHGPCIIVNNKSRKVKRPTIGRRSLKDAVCTHQSTDLVVQEPYMLSYIVCDRETNVIEEETIIGEECGDRFLEQLVRLANELIPPSLSPGIPYQISSTDRELLLQTTHCHICGFEMTNCVKVIDHDHLTGKVVGVAHNECNLRRRERKHLTVFCHNFSGFDSHFLIQCLAKDPSCIEDIDALPSNNQKFKMITLNRNIRMLDSLAFTQTGLDKLVNQLRLSGCSFNLMNDIVDSNGEKELLLRKGVFPYSAATSVDRLYAMTECPAKEVFFDELSESHIDNEDYNHFIKVWETFKPKNMMEYAVIYCKTDVRLLAEAVFDMREKIWADFGLDICAYLSLPMLSKDMWLKHTGQSLDLLYDQEMAFLCMQNIRGGLCFINQRSAGKGSLHEEKEAAVKKGHLIYLDVTNLYGKAMMMALPHSDFRWMNQEEVDNFVPLRDIDLTGDRGFILEVDLEYPEELHEAHQSFPLAPEKFVITEHDLSPYSRECYDAIYRTSPDQYYTQEKLTASFHNRTRYLLHGFNLYFYLQSGLKLKKIHRIITFKQVASIKEYIEYCTNKRREAKTESEKAYWKVR
jgi:hypothetical protein